MVCPFVVIRTENEGKPMIQLRGKSASPGVATGPLYYYKTSRRVVPRYAAVVPEAEWERFKEAQAKAITQLGALAQKARVSEGAAVAALFETHQMLAEDIDFEEAIQTLIIEECLNAEAAVADVGEQFADMFAAMEDAYMQGRAADVRDVAGRILNILTGAGERVLETEVPVILVADDLVPSETLQLDKSRILAFVTRQGSVSSHTAILARTMGIPAIVALGDVLDPDLEGQEVIIDGGTGVLVLDPDEPTRGALLEKRAREQHRKELMQALRGKESITLDGQRVEIGCNIASPEDIEAVRDNDGTSIGLFRSEFLYLQCTDFPTEEKQFRAYKNVLFGMGGKRVVIRTLDIGADKQVDYFNLPKEANPAMGMRAVRISLSRPEILYTQLRALYRASVYGKLAIMFPMITSVREIERCMDMVHTVKNDLTREGIPFASDVEIGIMIETPAAVLISDQLAQRVDFFSIGTNDLTQYLLACDRQAENLDEFYNPYHLAVLRAIRMTVENAHRYGKWAGICGELAGDLKMTQTFLAIGVDELSVSPNMVLPLRNAIRMTDAFMIRKDILARLDG